MKSSNFEKNKNIILHSYDFIVSFGISQILEQCDNLADLQHSDNNIFVR